MHKTRVAVLRGGLSDEYGVSLLTGASVLKHIDKNRFEPIDIIISKRGEWLVDGRVKLPEQLLHAVDVVFIALHGVYGEDGTVQRLLERYGIPYTGSKSLPSRIAMNKSLTKQYLRDTDIRMAPHVTIHRDGADVLGAVVANITKSFGPQYVLKPLRSGSSFGVVMVENPLVLQREIEHMFDTEEEVLVEERIHGVEATCGIIERFRGHEVYALPPIEIVPPQKESFFSNAAKYSGGTKEICPATFSWKLKEKIENDAKRVHSLLGLGQYSRSDFIIANDGVYFLEVNTLPGLTEESLFPKALTAVGDTHSRFITHLLTDAQARPVCG